MRVVGDAATDTVHGRCPPRWPYLVITHGLDPEFPFPEPWPTAYAGVAGADGIFHLEVDTNLRVGDGLDVICQTPAGDQVGRTGETR